MIQLSTLVPNESNPRTLSDKERDKLKKSLKDFPEMLTARPIIVQQDSNLVLGGNMKLFCLTEMGYTEIPDEWVKFVNFTEDQQREFLIKDNRHNGEWDFDELMNWDTDELVEFGFDKSEFKIVSSEPKGIITKIEFLTDADQLEFEKNVKLPDGAFIK